MIFVDEYPLQDVLDYVVAHNWMRGA